MSEGKKKFSLHRMGTISERSVVKQRKPITSTSSLENKSILLGLLSPEIPVVQTKTLSVPLDDTKDKPQQFYQTSLQFIFNAMGFTEEQTSKCMTKIDSEMTARQHKAIQNQTFLSPVASKEIKQLQLKINSVLEKQEQAEAAIRLQSLVRGHLLRKKFSKYTPEAKKRLKLWTGSFSQILLLEKRYLGKLQLLKQYLAPLEPTNNVMPGTENTAHYLQSNFQRLLETHEILLEDLEALANSPGFPFSSRLGACLLENFSRIGPAYMTYAKNYQASMEVLDYYSNNIPQFLGLLEEIGSSSLNGYKKLKSLLQWPVEHLAALETKLNSIYTYYEDIENDREKLSRVITTLGFSSDITQTQINQQGLPAQLANIKKILAVEYQLEPLEKPLNLLAWSSRKLLKDGAMKINGKRNMQIYLFSDLVLITEKLVNSIRFVQTVELHKANIIRESDKDFVLITDTKETGTQCHCSSKSETADWIGKITSIIDNYSSHRIYGIPLTELILREKQPDGIPRVLKQTLGWVAKNAQDIEGIFRVPGDASVIGEYKVLYDCGMSKDIDFSLCSAHDVAGLCKLYLRELPEPLFPHDSYDKIVNTEQERENQQEEDVEGYTRKLADIVREVPKDRRKVLQFVLMFLKEFSVHSKQTKMTVENLSMVFSPNLVRPLVDTMDTAMKSPMITKFITFLIQNHEEVWEVASEGETIAAKEELASVQKLVQGLLQQDAVSLDDLMAIKASRPSQYIDLQSPSSPRGRESPRVAKAGSKKRHSLTKKSNLTPKKQEKDTPPLRDDPSPRYRKKKSHSFKLRRANTLTH